MILGGFFMMAVLLQVSLFGESQTVSFSGKDVPLKEIFAVIKIQTGVCFFYDAALLRNAKRVTIVWKNIPLETALNELFRGQPLTWVRVDKTVTVIKRQDRIIAVPE
jgi:hypothetical protein